MKNPTLLVALFFCEAIPAFLISHYIYAKYTIAFLTIILIAISLIFSWFFADKNKKYIKNLGYAGILIGVASSVVFFKSYESSTGILIIALSMIIGINISLRERRMLSYLLITSFILFLYASSIIYNKYSIPSVLLFTFSFFTVVIADYYNSRLPLQSQYNYQRRKSFFATTLVLIVMSSILTATLYYLLPQPKAIHYGILPFGGKKEYKGIVGEGNVKSKYYKKSTTKLPQYTMEGKHKKPTADVVNLYDGTTKINNIHENKHNNTIKEKNLKHKNRSAYYSSLNTKTHNNSLSKILFEVKGKEALFLRGNTYASFNGKSWTKILDTMYTIKKGSRDSYSYWNGKEWKRRTKAFIPNDFYYNEYFTKQHDNYTITIKGKLAGKPIVYTPLGVLRLQFPTDTFYEDAARTLYAPSQLETGTYYTTSIESEKYYGYDSMSYADVWYKNAYSRIEYRVNPRTLKLAKKLTKSWSNSFEKAQAIIQYFKTHYLYKHSSIQSPLQNQTISEMLFKTKIGNALQFNSALIIMLRSRGVYARLVTGYAPSEYNQTTNSYLVERQNKAVWSEIFVKGRGWVAIHAADDIPFEGEEVTIISDKVLFTKTQLILLSILLLFIFIIFLYYIRTSIWTYLAKSHIQKYAEKNNIDFVIDTYKEVERYYKHFEKGQKISCTLQEYEHYLKELKPENSYLIEYLSFYSNQAIYKRELDLEFDKDRYLNVALYLVNKPFKIESFKKYVAKKIFKYTK